ncbi:MAG TPA: hypothetical protein VL993_17245 [Stellaceae bacterium]|nr:hypothetical protein [Stellaceae bacterium]
MRNLFILSEAPKARSRRALLLSLLVLPLAACGKKGALEPPPDAPKTQYPRVYPNPSASQ